MPFHLPWDHSADYQRQTCMVLNKQNLVVCYMHHNARYFLKRKPPKKYPIIKNIYFYSPRYIIPFRRFAEVEKLNQLINLLFITLRYGVGKRVILWIFDPMFYFYPKVKLIFPWIRSLYDCVDYHWSRKLDETKLLRSQEKLLIKNADHFFVNSQTLANIHKSLRRPDAILPLGFALDIFKKHEKDKLPNKLRLPHDKPIIGYIGSLNWRLDYNLLNNLISNNPLWTFAFFSPLQHENFDVNNNLGKNIKNILSMKNVIYGGELRRSQLPRVIAQFNVCIIPYDISLEFNRYCYPMKLFEYFYMGKPVITTPILELKQFYLLISIRKNAVEWTYSIKKLLKTRSSQKYRLYQRKLAIENSWEKKIEAIGNNSG